MASFSVRYRESGVIIIEDDDESQISLLVSPFAPASAGGLRLRLPREIAHFVYDLQIIGAIATGGKK